MRGENAKRIQSLPSAELEEKEDILQIEVEHMDYFSASC